MNFLKTNFVVLILIGFLVILLLVVVFNLKLDSSATLGESNERSSVMPVNNVSKLNKYSKFNGELPLNEIQSKKAILETEKGNIEIKLFYKEAPQTVSNFVFLINDGFYNNLTFHRRVADFVVQGGDPAGNGTGGPGYTVPAELSSLSHTRGRVAMARLPDEVNPKKDSSGSQFYITLADVLFLDNEYTVFGEVISGMDVVDKLIVGDKIIKAEVADI